MKPRTDPEQPEGEPRPLATPPAREPRELLVRRSPHPDHAGKIEILYNGFIYHRLTPEAAAALVTELQRLLSEGTPP